LFGTPFGRPGPGPGGKFDFFLVFLTGWSLIFRNPHWGAALNYCIKKPGSHILWTYRDRSLDGCGKPPQPVGKRSGIKKAANLDGSERSFPSMKILVCFILTVKKEAENK
jgi:hypothetical protein